MTSREQFEVWAKSKYELNEFGQIIYELNEFGQIIIGGDPEDVWDTSYQDCFDEMFDSWQARGELDAKRIAELETQVEGLINTNKSTMRLWNQDTVKLAIAIEALEKYGAMELMTIGDGEAMKALTKIKC